MFWSGGKDSALALDRVRRRGDYEVTSLITTINPEFSRVSMHGIREPLVLLQARAAGLPLQRMHVGSASTNETYVEALRGVLADQRARGVEAVIFGDIFLADLRAWRETFLKEAGVTGVFPLWGEDTRVLAHEFIERGFEGLICCVDNAHLDEQALGRALDQEFFESLPPGVDPCGENGEYHSFVYAGPIFRDPVGFAIGERVYRPIRTGTDQHSDDADPSFSVPTAPDGTQTTGFWFLDLLPEN
jgi:uncharacterized protein (TIGR00290 family)